MDNWQIDGGSEASFGAIIRPSLDVFTIACFPRKRRRRRINNAIFGFIYQCSCSNQLVNVVQVCSMICSMQNIVTATVQIDQNQKWMECNSNSEWGLNISVLYVLLMVSARYRSQEFQFQLSLSRRSSEIWCDVSTMQKQGKGQYFVQHNNRPKLVWCMILTKTQ